MPSKRSLLRLLKKSRKILILTHRSADVDSIASAGALYFALQKKYTITLGVPDHINAAAHALADHLKLKFTLNPTNIHSYDALIFVDVNSLSLLGSLQSEIKSFKGPKIVIDHHDTKGANITSKKYSLIQPRSLSTAQMVYEIIQSSSLPLPSKAATLIAAGIISDSAGFLIGDPSTFRILSNALEKSKYSYTQILSLFKIQPDISEKVALLKAAHRNRIYNSNSFLIVTTKVGHFEASASNYMIFGGADISFAAGKDENGIILSARASSTIVDDVHFHLARDVLKKLPEEFGGNAGGHPGAASYNVEDGNLDVLLEKCVTLTHSFLKDKIKSNKPLKEY